MEVVDNSQGHSKAPSLPWRLILQKMSSTLNQASDILKSVLMALKKYPLASTVVGLAENGVNASLPCLKSAAAFTEKGVRAGLPYVKTSVDYSAEKVKQHPYLSGSIILVLLFRRFGGGSGGGKTMKAPGRDGRIFRADFEGNPRGYFRDLRGKGGNWN